jgi:hypothetical protein
MAQGRKLINLQSPNSEFFIVWANPEYFARDQKKHTRWNNW